MYVMVEMVVKVTDYLYLLIDYFRKDSVFNCKQTSDSTWSLLNASLYAHPKRNSSYYFKNNASKTPYVNNPWIFVFLHLFKHYLIVL